ncbi:MAG: formate/nitrite transporter family protein [Eisenbergiella sp.]
MDDNERRACFRQDRRALPAYHGFCTLRLRALRRQHVLSIPTGLFIQAEYGLAAEGLTWVNFIFKNLVPVTLGNLVGGMAIVGAGYWFLYRNPKN